VGHITLGWEREGTLRGGGFSGARGGAVWGTIEFPDRGPSLVSVTGKFK
jgi:hypothetical protein